MSKSLKTCWENYKEDFDYWSPEDGDFNLPRDLVFIKRGNSLLTRRIKPVAEWEVMVKDGKYSRSIGFLVPIESAKEVQKGVKEYRKKHGTPEERRQEKFEKQYSDWKDALQDAANATFNLNRYAKYERCSNSHREKIYELKNQFVEELYKKGYAQAVWKHIVESDWLICNHCDGTGICERGFCKYDCVSDCKLCNGKGEWKPPDKVYFCFQFEIQGQRYIWHQPEHVMSFPPKITDPPEDWDGIIEEKPVELKSREFAEAKSLIRWVLDSMD